MKNIKKGFLVVVFLFLFWGAKEVLAEACAGISNPGERITCLNNELAKLSSQSKTLSNQIAQFDAQIKLTQLKIAQTEEQIALLGDRISQLEGSLDLLFKAFSSRAVATYKMARGGSALTLFLTSDNLNRVVAEFNYLKRLQEADRNLLNRLTVAQTTYKSEKVDQESLQAELTKQKANLDTQKKAKNALLSQTKNDEKRYSQLLAEAYAEKAAIEKALIAGSKVGPVKKGDAIALVGNSGYPGCSTGKHLHFEIRKDDNWTDPGQYLKNKSLINCQDYSCGSGISPNYVSLGSGSWDWPVEDSIHLTQFYGHTPYSWRYAYSGQIHTGYDLVPQNSDVIRAPADGTLFKSSQSCGGSTINIVYIDHGGGIMSLYLHVQ